MKRPPSVDKLIREVFSAGARLPRPLVAEAARETVAAIRAGDLNGLDPVALCRQKAEERLRSGCRSAINATGVLLHTGLGRAPLCKAAQERVSSLHHASVEIELDSGRRGDRQAHCRWLLQRLTGCEDALIVNNNAAAVFLTIRTLAAGREAIVSRGQLIEIGGSFRLPDIIEQAGARMREVGTTNKTRIEDYERAINDQTALILRCHPSNFKIEGFTEEASIGELSELARSRGIPLMDDAGSGCLIDTRQYGLPHEPTLQESLKANVVTASGDKLIGGPQAGLVLGDREIVSRLASNPLMRALRPGAITLAALEATLETYLYSENPVDEIPIWRMILESQESLRKKARRLKTGLPIVDTVAAIGGGALPGLSLPSIGLQASDSQADEVARKLRSLDPPVFPRIVDGKAILDLRSMTEGEIEALPWALKGL